MTALDLVRDLIAFDTTSRDSNLKLIDYAQTLLEKAGARCRRSYNQEGDKANLFATIGPEGDGGFVLSGHTDVVPVEGQPFPEALRAEVTQKSANTWDVQVQTKVAKAVAAGEPPFPLRVSGLGAFPTPRRPKILWAGITEGAESLVRLYDKLEVKLLDLGCYRKEERGYTPHLTLGRVKSEADGLALAPELPKRLAWDAGRTMIDEVLVFSSVLERAGTEYTVLGRGELKGK
jgi:2'-5' RNA ligase